jgi:hypothetical protein
MLPRTLYRPTATERSWQRQQSDLKELHARQDDMRADLIARFTKLSITTRPDVWQVP